MGGYHYFEDFKLDIDRKLFPLGIATIDGPQCPSTRAEPMKSPTVYTREWLLVYWALSIKWLTFGDGGVLDLRIKKIMRLTSDRKANNDRRLARSW